MKTCPVCKTTLFDDMEVCYGCMHRFGENDGSTAGGAPAESSCDEGRRDEGAGGSCGESPTQPLPIVSAGEVRAAGSRGAALGNISTICSLSSGAPSGKDAPLLRQGAQEAGEGVVHASTGPFAYEEAPAPSSGEGACCVRIKLEVANGRDAGKGWVVELLLP